MSDLPIRFFADCPSRFLLDQISGKWSILILVALSKKPCTFNVLKRAIEGISQKALSDTLKKLEFNGIVKRTVLATQPVSVEYCITPLGHTLSAPLEALYRWTQRHLNEVEQARSHYEKNIRGRSEE